MPAPMLPAIAARLRRAGAETCHPPVSRPGGRWRRCGRGGLDMPYMMIHPKYHGATPLNPPWAPPEPGGAWLPEPTAIGYLQSGANYGNQLVEDEPGPV